MSDFTAFLLFGLALLGAVGVGEGLRAWAGWPPEGSRRAVHALVGVMVAFAVPLFEQPGWIYVLAAAFAGVNVVAVRRRYFPGMHGVARRSWGTVTFPLALVAALFLCWTLDPGRLFALQAAFLVLALADSLASLVGTRVARPGNYIVNGHTKSLAGTSAFFGAAFGLVAGALLVLRPEGFGAAEVLVAAVVAAGLSAAAEALGGEGWDNLVVVLAVIVPLAALDGAPETAGRMGIALGAAVLFGGVAWRAGFLDVSGALAAGLLAWGVLALGGWAWVAPGFTFFFLSSLLSRWGRRRKAEAEQLAEKPGRRDAGQVAANGGMAGLLLGAHAFWPHEALYWGFVGAFAAAAADTWGTEVGTYFRRPTRSVLTGRQVAPGTSGGVSVPGTLAAVAGACAVGASALPFTAPHLGGARLGTVAALVVAGGLAGALLDSVLGATVQARYRLSSGALTERMHEDGAELALAAGYRWVTNDRVNLACTAAGAAVPLLYFLR
jgi:uncharacterized protein (TIGR00297 family)